MPKQSTSSKRAAACKRTLFSTQHLFVKPTSAGKIRRAGKALLALSLLWLTGCQTVARQPQGVPTPNPAQQAAELQQQQVRRLEVMDQQLKELGGRITLVQEQLALLRQQGETLALSSQGQLQGLQRLQASLSVPTAAPATIDAQEQALADLMLQLEQRLAQLSEESPAETVEEYRLVSTYTPKGRWVVLRYLASSGETWTIDGGQWLPVEELETLPLSTYRLVINAADADKKGYVAARIDQQSGRSWWLKDNRWHPLEEG